nr:DeoR family transcriptional regulator [Candidatus Sigynarchaeota archaeon]
MAKQDSSKDAAIEHHADNSKPFSATLSLQQRIFTIAKKMMALKYILNTHELYIACRQELRETDKAAIQIEIENMLRQKMFFEGKHITKHDVLENQARRKIWAIVLQLPGIHFSKLRQMLGMGNAILQWHLSMLDRFGLIRKRDEGNKQIYFPGSMGTDLDSVYIGLHKSRSVEIIETIAKAGAVRMHDLSDALDIPESTIRRKLQELANSKVLINQEDGTVKINTQLEQIIFQFMKNAKKFDISDQDNTND